MKNRITTTALGLLSFAALSTVTNAELVALWDFNTTELGATIGNPLSAPGTRASSVAGIPGMAGDGAYSLDNGAHYTALHGMSANGGGSRVNQYSLLWDIKLIDRSGYSSLWKHDGESDGSLFIKSTGTVGLGALGAYTSNSLSTGTWYRIIQTYNTSTGKGSLFVNGVEWKNNYTVGAQDNARFTLTANGSLDWFQDNTSEEKETYVSNLALYDHAINSTEASNLGQAGDPISAGITANLDTNTGIVTLNWITYNLAGLSTPSIKITRNGALLTTLPATDTSYSDSPPAPVLSQLNYSYEIELFDGPTLVAGSSAEDSVSWSPALPPTDLSAQIDHILQQVLLTWSPAESNFQADGIKVFRDGLEIADLPLFDLSYLDYPAPPITIPLSYNYTIQAYGGSQGGAHTEITTAVTWTLDGLPTGVIAEYRFEDGFSDTANSAATHDGVAVNGTSIAGNGVFGHAASFLDQLKQGVHVNDHSLLDFGSDQDFTVSLWMKRDGTSNIPGGEPNDGVLLCKQDRNNSTNRGWGLYATSDGGVKWHLRGDSSKSVDIAPGVSGGDTGSSTSSNLPSLAGGVWHQITVSNDRSDSARCYIDGVFIKSISIAGAGSVDNNMKLSMGIDGNGNNAWKGSLDEVSIWDHALSDSEVFDVFRLNKQGRSLSGQSIIDSDQDGLSDEWEINHFGNLNQSAEDDSDNDGRNNFQEFAEGSNPTAGAANSASRITSDVFEGDTYPILHYVRPALAGDISYIPESSVDLKNWSSGDSKFIPHGNPVDIGNGQREYSVRFHLAMDAVTARQMMFRVRMQPQYQGGLAAGVEPSVELRNGQAVVIWWTDAPSVTILNYGFDGQAIYRFEDYTLSTYHEVVIDDIDPGDAFTYSVAQLVDGVETQSNTFTTSGEWDYSPPAVPDQLGFDSGANWSAQADAILAQPDVLDRGYCLDYLCGDARLAYELVRKSQLVIIGVEDTQAKVDAARAFLCERGVYGSRVTVVLASDLANLPFSADFFNLIVSQSQIASGSSYSTFNSAVERHAIPDRGAVVGLDGGTMNRNVKPINTGTGSWTSSYGNPSNTSSSVEEFNGKTSMDDFELRWLGAPGPELAWDRGMAEQPPLAVNGRFYCQGLGRILALDSHNGSVLWTKELDDAQRFNLLRDAGNLSADQDAVWLSLRKECWRMAGDTGALTTYPLVEGPRPDLDYVWNYVCSTGTQLLGSASVDQAFYKEHWGQKFWYVDAGKSGDLTMTKQVVSDNIFSLDKASATTNWEYSNNSLILSVSITLGNGKIYFLETRNPSALSANSRRLPSSTWKTDLALVCLDLETGVEEWRETPSLAGGSHTVFLMYAAAQDKLVISSGDGSNNHLDTFNASTGSFDWKTSALIHKGDHGGVNQHAVISGNEILFVPNTYDLATGSILNSDIPENDGAACSTYWGSKNMLFMRNGYSGKGLAMWEIGTSNDKTGMIDHVRGSCWLNYAPADGMFLIQEKSAGCSCGAWVHISQGWGPTN